MKLVELPDRVCLQPQEPPTCTLICLHGLGADGYDWIPILQRWTLPQPTQSLCLHAPYRNVTVNQGLSMRAWYDVFDRTLTMREDEQGLQQATQSIATLIHSLKQTMPIEHQIFLIGFSMGGALALHVALTIPGIQGAAGLASYLPLAKARPSFQPLPVFLAHGQQDDIIPLDWAKQSYHLLLKQPHTKLHTYPMGHYIGEQLIKDLQYWLSERSAHAPVQKR